jgi:DNA-directed RNA polymerase specialized sigma24 family protein
MSVVLRPDPLGEIEAVYHRDLARFVRVARAIIGEEQRAYDAVQEAFTRAVERRRSFRRRGPIEAWLWRIVVNEARKQVGSAGGEAAAHDVPVASNGRPSADAEVRAAIAALPESRCFCAITPISIMRRSRPRSESGGARWRPR